jgi:Amt family ammonium transporter
MVSHDGSLREDHGRLERVLEASGLGLWELDLDTGDFHVDPRCARNLGYGPGQLQPSWDTGVAIIHPDDAIRVSRLFEAHLRGETPTLEYETRMLTHDRAWTWVAGRGRVVRDAGGRATHVSGTLKNIDAERAARETLAQANARLEALTRQLQHQALHDPLTGLLNRRGFELRLAALLESAQAHGRMHALCYLDLDHFKVVNDACGHAAGDALLRHLPAVLQQCLRPGDELARLGGDEFALLLEDCPLAEAATFAETLRDAVRAFRFAWQQRSFALGASVGVVAITAASRGAAAVLGGADAACYVAKEHGPNHVHVSWPRDPAILRRRGELRWVARLKAALDEDRFLLHAMSIARLADADAAPPRHHELLLRLAARDGRLIPPGAFLAVAERYQLMPQVDRWVIDHALRWLGQAVVRTPDLRGHRFGINVSGESLRDARFAEFVERALVRHRVPPAMAYFEFTETAAIANLDAAREFMRSLKALGCQMALDDFGNGMSSFTYLKHLPVDLLKIDGSFVRDLVRNPVDQAIVRAVHAVGTQMGIATVAEYVEDAPTRDCLREIGVQYGQGYAIARPAALDSICGGATRGYLADFARTAPA